MTKIQEIELLDKLMKGKGYFAEYFQVMYDQMVYNIQSDFPIELNTVIGDHAETIKRLKGELTSSMQEGIDLRGYMSDLRKEVEKRGSVLHDLLADLVRANNPVVHKYYDFKEILKAKITLGIDLDQEDRELLIKLADL